MSDFYLYVYDLTKGMARQFSAMFLGKHFDGIWHTGVVAFGREWYFGNEGIDSCPPKGTILGEPDEIIHLGKLEMTEDDFSEIIRQMSETSYKLGSYNLLDHNCNNFSNDLAQILVGKPIPSHIIDLPKEILNTPIGPMLRPLLEQAADPLHQMGSGGSLFGASSQAARGASSMNNQSAANQARAKQPTPRTMSLFKEKFPDQLSGLLAKLESKISQNENKLMGEIKDYLSQSEPTCSIGNAHIKLLFKLYLSEDIDQESKLSIIKILEQISLDENIARTICNEPMLANSLIPSINDLPTIELKIALLEMLSNLCSHKSISEKLLESNQDAIFKSLSDFALFDAHTDAERTLHEASISFFFNLISAYHLEKKLNESNSLTLGCALLERLPKVKSKPKTIYQMLSLLRSCLTNSQSMRELAVSMEFDLSQYKHQSAEQSEFSKSLEKSDSSTAKNDCYDAVVNGIDDLIHK